MYARGMTVREIQGHLAEMYGVDVSPDLISRVTDEVMAEAAQHLADPLQDKTMAGRIAAFFKEPRV